MHQPVLFLAVLCIVYDDIGATTMGTGGHRSPLSFDNKHKLIKCHLKIYQPNMTNLAQEWLSFEAKSTLFHRTWNYEQICGIW